MSYRKPEWDWTLELRRAQAGGVSDVSADAVMEAVNSLNNVNIDNSATVPLFSNKWIEKTAKNTVIGALSMAPPTFGSSTQHSASAPGGGDYYPGTAPGFVVGCTPEIIDECFQKYLF